MHMIKYRSLYHLNTILAFVIAILTFVPGPASSQVFVGGELTQNTTFSKVNNPYIVFQELIVPEGITLTIEPGTELLFSSDTRLLVQGTIVAQGSVTDSIRMMLNLQIPNQSLWNGVVFDGVSTQLDPEGNYVSGSLLSYVSIYNTNYSITLKSHSSVLIEHCLVRKSSYGLYINDAVHSMIRNNRIAQTAFGVFIPSGVEVRENTFRNNEISQNFNIGFLINNSQGLVRQNLLTGNLITENYIGLYIGNDGAMDAGNNKVINNFIYKNALEGVRIYQDSTQFSGNYVQNNGTGIAMHHTLGTHVTENVISDNKDWAIKLIDSASGNLVQKNVLSRNGGGIWIAPNREGNVLNNSFIQNTLFNNHGISFLIQSAPQQLIAYNNFLLDGDTNSFVNRTAVLIHAENNWWGTMQEPSIDSIIYDELDDASLGLVQYKFPLSTPDTVAPIPPPRNVIKRQAGDDVLVTWDPVEVSDLDGYFVYYGKTEGITYEHQLDAGNTTTFILPSHSVFDSIAVSSYDTDADGLLDQPEGHESLYAVAQLSPYAGPDTTICYGQVLQLEEATAFNYEYISWTTSGDGSFSGAHILKPRYTPGSQDYQNGSVELTLFVAGAGFSLTDRLRVFFRELPQVFAGNDTLIFSDTSYTAHLATIANVDTVSWSSSGDGTFSDPYALHPSYTPGPGDIESGSCLLVMSGISPCGIVQDTLNLELLHGYNIRGRVIAGTELAAGSSLWLYQAGQGIAEGLRGITSAQDGSFEFRHVVAGDYYIFVVPPAEEYKNFLPTYYYNKVHWEEAYKLPVIEDTYDIDVELVRSSLMMPEGEGSISGYCTASGGTSQSCGNIVVLLYDRTQKYLLGWAVVDNDGNFIFPALPFGEYVIVGEKAGYKRFSSDVIKLGAENPSVINVMLKIEPYKISFIVPSPGHGGYAELLAFPNPAGEQLIIENFPNDGLYEGSLISTDGRSRIYQIPVTDRKSVPLDLNHVSPGIYFLRVTSGSRFIGSLKIIKW